MTNSIIKSALLLFSIIVAGVAAEPRNTVARCWDWSKHVNKMTFTCFSEHGVVFSVSNENVSCWSMYGYSRYNQYSVPIADVHKVEFEECDFYDMPHIVSELYNLRILDVSSTLWHVNELNTNINVSSQLEKFIAQNGNITTVGPSPFTNMPNLTTLNLSHNQISNIHPIAFTVRNKIATIDLSYNKITTFDKYLFRDLAHLTKFYVQHNNISDLAWLTKMTNLEQLDLSFNNIFELPTGQLCRLLNLEILNLSNNGLTSITYETFQSLHRLQVLNLSYNNIQHASFDGLVSLRTLSLSHNHINRISAFNLSNLEELDLARNDIVNFNDAELNGSFSSMKKLKIFDVSHNKLKSIDVPKISNLFHQLNGLFLQGNNLTTIDSEIAKLLPDLVDLGISHNNFNCDWLDNFLESFPLQLLRKIIVAEPADPNKTTIYGIECVDEISAKNINASMIDSLKCT